MRTFERMLRRAQLPFQRTQGFHPKPRLVFALSLPLGIIARDEVVELELQREIAPDELKQRLARQAPPGLQLTRVCRIPVRTGAQVRSLSYALPIPQERTEGLQLRMAELMAASECWIDRTRPPQRRLDLRPFLRDLRLEQQQDYAVTLHALMVMDLWLLPSGTARPEEVLQLLHLQDLLQSGAVLERSRLELVDEQPPPPAPQSECSASRADVAPE
jgi:radical SAM-linked protein